MTDHREATAQVKYGWSTFGPIEGPEADHFLYVGSLGRNFGRVKLVRCSTSGLALWAACLTGPWNYMVPGHRSRRYKLKRIPELDGVAVLPRGFLSWHASVEDAKAGLERAMLAALGETPEPRRHVPDTW